MNLVGALHEAVARDLGDDRRGGDRRLVASPSTIARCSWPKSGTQSRRSNTDSLRGNATERTGERGEV